MFNNSKYVKTRRLCFDCRLSSTFANLLIVILISTFVNNGHCFGTTPQPKFDNVNGLIAAFGDYDSDKLTDVFVIDQTLRSFRAIKHYEKGQQLRTSIVECKGYSNDIVGIIPGDFHGNVWMDVVLVMRHNSTCPYKLHLLQGNTTNFDCNAANRKPFAYTMSQPLMLDWNGDMISDLVADDCEGNRTVWIFQNNGTYTKSPFSVIGDTKSHPIRDPNANAFINLSPDGVADIIIDANDRFEYWLADESRNYGTKEPLIVNRPENEENFKYYKFNLIGQSAFMDVNGDDRIEHLVPLCNIESCIIVALNATINDNYKSELNSNVKFEPNWVIIADKFAYKLNGTTSKLKFKESEYPGGKNSLPLPVTLRHGDLNGDGFPDIVALMHFSVSPDENRVILLENVASSENFLKRTFQPFSNQPTISNAIIAAMFDIAEDSKLDIVATVKQTTDKPKNQTFAVRGKLNSQMFDQNFIKILVASGLCPQDQCFKEGWVEQQYRVNYGTNSPGPFVSYKLLDSNGNLKKACAGQLSQSSHFALQVPYMILGLGSYANYVDEITITVPGGNSKVLRQHLIEKVVPDAQVIVIPHPPNEPKYWITKMFLYPSEIIYKRLYTLLGMCLLLLIIIAVLQKIEAIEDEKERQTYRQIMFN